MTDRADRRPEIAWGHNIEPREVSWLWPHRIPRGKITVIAGDGGLGKSMLTLDLIARVTRGDAWPDLQPNQIGPSGAVVMNAEDDAADTLVPRLMAAGVQWQDDRPLVAIANDYRFTVGGVTSIRSINLVDSDVIGGAIIAAGASIAVIDPASAFMGGGADENKDQDVRSLLRPLADVAAQTECAIVVVKHLNKSQARNASHRVGGSVAWGNASRCMMGTLRDPDDYDSRILAPIKNNLGDDRTSIRYHIEDTPLGPRVVWGNVFEAHADDLMAQDKSRIDESVLNDAIEYLRQYLAAGESPASEIMKHSKEAGYDKECIVEARNRLGLQSRAVGTGSECFTTWALPTSDDCS